MVRRRLSAAERSRGERLGRLLRDARGPRSMVEVAAAAGVGVEALRKIESGRVPTPAFFTVVAVAAELGVDPALLAQQASADTGVRDAGDAGDTGGETDLAPAPADVRW